MSLHICFESYLIYYVNFRITQQIQLQALTLDSYGNLLTDLELQLLDYYKISVVVLKYIDSNQPEMLQNCAVNYFSKLKNYDGPFAYSVLRQHKRKEGLHIKLKRLIESFPCKS